VGNGSRFVVSELAGRSTLTIKAAELGLDLDDVALGDVLDTLKRLEHQGYHYEAADGSLELLMRQATGWEQSFFEVESFRVITEHRPDQVGQQGGDGEAGGDGRSLELGPSSFEGLTTEATVKIHVAGERIVATAEGNGPVHALDAALRQAIGPRLPGLAQLHLTDYRVRVLDTAQATGAVTRVLIDSTDGERSWSTIGVSENIIEASWQALVDSIVYGLLHQSAEASERETT
jgi:2-isopropylmalate synthase